MWGECESAAPTAENCMLPGDESCDGVEHVCSGSVDWALPVGDEAQEIFYDVTVDGAGHVVVVGTSYLVGTGENQATMGFLVLKVSSEGEILWSHTFDGFVQVGSVGTDSENNIYVAAYSDECVFGAAPCAQPGQFVAKLNPDGQPVWVRGLDGDSISPVLAVSANGLIATVVYSPGSSTVVVMNVDGEEVSRFPAVPSAEVRDLAFDPDGNVVMVGVLHTLSHEPFVAKTDSLGTPIWHKQYYGGIFNKLAINPAGDIFVVGTPWGNQADLIFDTTVAPFDSMFGVKFSVDGDEVWVRTIALPRWDEGVMFDVAVDTLGNPVLVGFFDGPIDFGFGPEQGSEDSFFVKLDREDGRSLWTSFVRGMGGADFIHAVASDGNHAHYAVGTFSSAVVVAGGIEVAHWRRTTGEGDALLLKISE